MKLRPDYALFVLWVGMMLVLFRPELHGFDTVAYYSWLRSPLIRGTLDVSETFARYGYLGERGLSPTGYRLNEWPVGPALLWLPFFLAGHLAALATRAPADGFSAPYLVFTALGSSLYGLAGLLLVRRLMLDLAGPGAAFWAVLGIWLASPLVFYMSAHPFMAHAPDFFINALFLWLWVRRDGPWPSRIGLGLVGGLAASVRYQNMTLLLWPALEDLVRVRRGLWDGLARLGALGLGALVGFSPQLIVWRVVFGEWVVLNPYGLTGAGGFDLRSPHFLDVLFSADRGLFPWMPLSVFGVLGLFGPLLRRRPALARLTGAQFLAQVYLVGSWSSWSGGAAFGPRLLVGLLPGLGLGLAALYDGWARRRAVAPAGLSLAFAAFNFILLARYGLGDIPRAGPVSPEGLWLGQFTFLLNLPGRVGPLLEALLRRAP